MLRPDYSLQRRALVRAWRNRLNPIEQKFWQELGLMGRTCGSWFQAPTTGLWSNRSQQRSQAVSGGE
jgi:hypothetical protein